MKRFVTLFILVLFVIAGWSIAWFWAAGEAKRYIVALGEGDGVLAPKLTCARLSISGYPFGFDLACTGAQLVDGDTVYGLAEIKATALVYNPTHVLMFAKASLDMTDAFTGAQRRLDFANFEGSLRLTDWRIARVSVIADKLAWVNTLLGDSQLASADHAEFHLIDIPERHDAKAHLAPLAAYAMIEGAVVPGAAIHGGSVSFEAELNGLPDDIRNVVQADPLRAWQRAGGRFVLTSFKGEDGVSHFESSGTLGLDDQGRLEGQIKIASNGVVERLGPLVPDNMKGLLLGAQAADGGYAQTLNIRAGIVFSGLIPAAVIPPLY